MKYGVGNWDPESGLGNHRAVVRVEAPPAPAGAKGRAIAKPPAVRVAIPWRRRDLEPEKKGLIVVDSASGERIMNVCALSVGRRRGGRVVECT